MNKMDKFDLLPLLWSLLPIVFLSIYNVLSSYLEAAKIAYPFYDQAGIVLLCIVFFIISKIWSRDKQIYLFICTNILIFIFNPITSKIGEENSLTMKIFSSFLFLPAVFLTSVKLPVEYINLITRIYFFLSTTFFILVNNKRILDKTKELAKVTYFVLFIMWVITLIYYKLII